MMRADAHDCAPSRMNTQSGLLRVTARACVVRLEFNLR